MGNTSAVRQILMNELGLTREGIRKEMRSIVAGETVKVINSLTAQGHLERMVQQEFRNLASRGYHDRNAIERICVEAAKKEAESFIRDNLRFSAPPPAEMLAGMPVPEDESTRMGVGKEDVKWIVNDLGELGVEIDGRCFFLYKGESLEYEGKDEAAKDGVCRHDDGSQMLYRRVGKREFGEVQLPQEWVLAGRSEDRYTAKLTFYPELSLGKPEDSEWKTLPSRSHSAEMLEDAKKKVLMPVDMLEKARRALAHAASVNDLYQQDYDDFCAAIEAARSAK